MKVPFQLRPTPAAEPAAALLVPGHQAEDVLRLCAALGLPALPPVYRTADGFILKLAQPLTAPLAGVVRLRGLASDLLLPVHAELVPPLLADEAEALVRRRGLVFLPGGRVLEYRPDEPVTPGELLQVGDVRRPRWQVLPEAPAVAEDVTEIALDLPVNPELLLEGGDGVGTETPELPGSGLPSRVLGNAMFGLGKGIAWMGKSLNFPGLAGLGAAMLGGAMSLVPRLSEKLLGAQEAVLRELLRQLREGDVEEALRRALPLGGDDARGGVAAQDAQLPRHDLYYSLVNLLGGRRRGPAGVWFAGGNTIQELYQEYRKQAEAAAARGDFRRAAFIYGKLLRDYRSAALLLARGGLHRDAAVLYERKLHDLRAAAREWEAAGEIDRALNLYRSLGEYGLAGDLLRRAGEEGRAVAEYQTAAAKLVEAGPRFYEAGELLESRALRPDLAAAYFRRGWEARPQGNAVGCAVRLARHHAAADGGGGLLALVDEVDAFLRAEDVEPASTFYNELARLADRPALAALAAELRDRARLGLARPLRHVGPGRAAAAVSALFPVGSPWPAPLVRDAAHALRQTVGRVAAPPRRVHVRRRTGPSIVRAAHQLPVSKEVFLGLENGEVLCYRPELGGTAVVAADLGPVRSIGSFGTDDALVVLSQAGPERLRLTLLSRANGFRVGNHQEIDSTAPAWLCTHVADRQGDLVGVCYGTSIWVYRVPDLVAHTTLMLDGDRPAAAVMGPVSGSPRQAWLLAFYPSRAVYVRDVATPAQSWFGLPWTPVADDGALAHPLLHAAWNDGDPLEVIGVGATGGAHRTRLRPDSTAAPESYGSWPGRGERFCACARIRTDRLAAVTRQAVHWLHTAHAVATTPTPHELSWPVAAFALPATGELLVIDADGSLSRVPAPD